MDTSSEKKSENSVSEEAAEWFLKIRENPSDERLIASWKTWLASDPQHNDAWLKVNKAWGVLGGYSEPTSLRSGVAFSLSTDSFTGGTVSKQYFKTGGVVTLLAAAACLLLILAPSWFVQIQADYYSRAGEILSVNLDDGTVLTLAGGSAVKVAFNKAERRVTLLAGEAFFDVAHETARPFFAKAIDLDVVVHGTSFNLRIGEDTTNTALLEGAVSAHSSKERTSLSPGEELILQRQSGQVVVRDIALNQIGSWRQKRLFIEDQTIASVAEQIGRYHHGWFAITDAGLASKRVTGVFDLSDPRSALNSLVEPFGGQVSGITDYFLILSSAN